MINGKRKVIRSGAMHYFRLPSQKLWRDRLYKLKAGGYNTVDLYFNWGYHSTKPGVYDFEGIRDVSALLTMVTELDLYLIARPGPYINAEVSGGGFPGWLLADKTVTLRHRKADGSFEWCDRYMAFVREWWSQIVPKINACPSLIALQIENEYATLEVEPDYMQALYKVSRELGITVPLFHNDLYAAGLYEDIVDLYAFDNYSVTSFQEDWRNQPETLAMLDTVEETLRPYCSHRPLFVAELQAGWYAGWKGLKYDQISEHLGRQHLGITTRSLLGQGLTMFNHYKAVGGTNWGYIGSTDTYTSYDFAAPISEAGLNTERLYEVKAINLMLKSFPSLIATTRVEPNASLAQQETYYALRQSIDFSEAQWLFLRNLKAKDESFTTLTGNSVFLTPYESVILPINIPLANGWTLVSSTSEVFCQFGSVLVINASRPTQVVLQAPIDAPLKTTIAIGKGHYHNSNQTIALSTAPLEDYDYTLFQVDHWSIICLSQTLTDRTWLMDSNNLLIGPNQLSESQAPTYPETQPFALSFHPNGQWQENPITTTKPEYNLPTLGNWQATNLSSPLYNHTIYESVSALGADFDQNGLYDGSAWYYYPLPTDTTTITIDARHLWAAYINGSFIGCGHHFLTHHGEQPIQPTTFSLIEHPHNHKTKDNTLVLFVDSLGHPKGFHDDAQTPQGLLTLEINGKNTLKDVSLYKDFLHPPEHPIETNPLPVVCLSTAFTLTKPNHIDWPVGVRLSTNTIERINIYLNDILIGRYWNACQSQEVFYLPDEVLLWGMPNMLSLVMMSFEAPLPSIQEALDIASHVSLTQITTTLTGLTV